MNNKIAKLLIISGIVCVIASLSLFIYNRKISNRAAGFAAEVVAKLQETDAETADSSAKSPSDPAGSRSASTETGDAPDSVSVKGYDFIGYISIPALRLNLPVMAEWSYDRLNISPCRYSGSPETDDLVVAAHNYTSHFGFLSELKVGDQVIFIDVHSKQTEYRVDLIDTLSPTDVAEMTSGEYDLTLFTCTYTGQARVTVRLNRIHE